MPDAKIQIDVGVNSRFRNNDQLWKETTIMNEVFHTLTNLDSYITDTPALSDLVTDYIDAERLRGAYVNVQVSVTLENVTHPTPGKGVVILPKAYREFQITDEEFTDADVLNLSLNNVIADLKQTARY